MSPRTSFPRSAGVLLHPTSLPGPFGIGDLGAGARAFVDWLALGKMTVWQVLPLVPPGAGNSPYSSSSAFAGNPWLLDPLALAAQGLLDEADIEQRDFDDDRVDFARVPQHKTRLAEKAARRLVQDRAHPLHARVEATKRDAHWAHEYALYAALKARHESKPWWEWDAPLAARDAGALRAAEVALGDSVDVVVAQQVLFEEQWRALRAYAHARGVRVVGDIPIYVDLDSADVWANREQFLLDAKGRPRAVAGVPPDAFSEKGQLWGNPLYDWPKMAKDGHRFFVDRVRRVLSLTDVVRIDHFRAFAAYWEVPAGAPDARGGRWVKGPGQALFDDLRKALGDLPIIAEDLGLIDDEVLALKASAGLPGMKVLQFAFGDQADNFYLPHNHEPNSVVYTGTHDNDTTLGWWKSAPDHVKDHVRRYLARDGADVVWDFVRTAFASVAHTAIVPMQDVLSLDSDARMNMPGQGEGNWGWRVRADAFDPHLAGRLRDLAVLYGRVVD